MSDVVIVDAARTAHGELFGSLADRTAVDLGSTAVQGVFERSGLHADVATDRGLEPMARVEDYAVVYRDPAEFGLAVIDAFTELLDRNHLASDDVDHYELNEAFAGQTVLAREELDLPDDRLNPRGGAVALGHPIGASGGILTTTLVHSMAREDHDRGIVGILSAVAGISRCSSPARVDLW